MRKRWYCRLTVIGAKAGVKKFSHSDWPEKMYAEHCELLENSRDRFACQFETGARPMGSLSALSRRQPGLVFLLNYEAPYLRTMGLAKAKSGTVETQEFTY